MVTFHNVEEKVSYTLHNCYHIEDSGEGKWNRENVSM